VKSDQQRALSSAVNLNASLPDSLFSALGHDERKDDVGNESEASEDDAENERDADDGDIHIQVFGKAGTHTEDLTFFADKFFG
jgi:hypothetical protein